jgi:hypothetical protein
MFTSFVLVYAVLFTSLQEMNRNGLLFLSVFLES